MRYQFFWIHWRRLFCFAFEVFDISCLTVGRRKEMHAWFFFHHWHLMCLGISADWLYSADQQQRSTNSKSSEQKKIPHIATKVVQSTFYRRCLQTDGKLQSTNLVLLCVRNGKVAVERPLFTSIRISCFASHEYFFFHFRRRRRVVVVITIRHCFFFFYTFFLWSVLSNAIQ